MAYFLDICIKKQLLSVVWLGLGLFLLFVLVAFVFLFVSVLFFPKAILEC